MSRFGLCAWAVIAAACGHAAGRAALSNRPPVAPSADVATGDYACRLEEGGYQYPPFRCVVEARRGRTWFEKVEGSVRLRGWITRAPGGFAFDGELYCPWGDCTEHVHTLFAADRAGGYRGTVDSLQSGPITVTLSAVVPGTGGQGYGGGGYGGGGYGGSGYGGNDSERIDY
jgi:hypothetical protein